MVPPIIVPPVVVPPDSVVTPELPVTWYPGGPAAPVPTPGLTLAVVGGGATLPTYQLASLAPEAKPAIARATPAIVAPMQRPVIVKPVYQPKQDRN